MIQGLEFEAVEGLPSGLCACKLDGKAVHVAAVSPRSIWLRTPEPIPSGGLLTLCLYRPEAGDYEFHILSDYQTGPAQRHDSAVLTRFSFDDAPCAAAIRRMLNSYARYLEIKSTCGTAAYAAHVSGYPQEADDVFFPDAASQRRAWYAQLPPLPQMPDGCSLAVELNRPELYQLYLTHPSVKFMAAYAAHHDLPESWLPHRSPDRLYIGNAFCRHLFPEETTLRAIAHKAHTEGLALTLVTAELRSHSIGLADLQIALAREFNAELAVNDWGMLERARLSLNPGQIILGTLLNRRRKDPRMGYKAGLAGREALLSCNALNAPLWHGFLKELGVERFEFESCGLSMEIPAGTHSLHLPFYQTNTSLWCPTRALCLHGERGAQADADACPHYCENNALLYPAHLKMIGRWNSLLALDDKLAGLSHPEAFDRWVLNF